MASGLLGHRAMRQADGSRDVLLLVALRRPRIYHDNLFAFVQGRLQIPRVGLKRQLVGVVSDLIVHIRVSLVPPTTKLSDAGGPRLPNRRPARPARIRSSNLVRRSPHRTLPTFARRAYETSS